MHYFVYILESLKDGSFYIGQTANIEDRLKRHNAGTEKYTRKKIPWKLIYSTIVNSRSEAMKLERKLKNFKSRKRILSFIDSQSGSRPE